MVIDDRFLEQFEVLVNRLESINVSHKRLMDVKEAAMYLGRTVVAVEQLVKRGTLPVTRLDGKIQFDREVLDKLIRDSTHW